MGIFKRRQSTSISEYQSFQRCSTLRGREDSVISAFSTPGTREDAVNSAFSTLGIREDSAISTGGTLGIWRTQSFQFLVPRGFSPSEWLGLARVNDRVPTTGTAALAACCSVF